MSGVEPPEGAHLALRLARIRQEVEERIDESESRRRRAWRVVVGASVAVALGASAATAAALSYLPPATVVVEVPVSVERLRCIDGVDAGRPAYFTVRYAVPAAAPDPVDAVLACQAAAELAGEIGDDLTPRDLLRAAAGVLDDADGDSASAPTVQHAAFGPSDGDAGDASVWTSCADGPAGDRVVLVHDPATRVDCEARG